MLVLVISGFKIHYCGNAASHVLLNITMQKPLTKDQHKNLVLFSNVSEDYKESFPNKAHLYEVNLLSNSSFRGLQFVLSGNIHNKAVCWWGPYFDTDF